MLHRLAILLFSFWHWMHASPWPSPQVERGASPPTPLHGVERGAVASPKERLHYEVFIRAIKL